MYILYSLLLAVGFALSLPWFLWKGRGTGKYRRSFRERVAGPPPFSSARSGPTIWIHAVSVGETVSARPLLPALRRRLPEHRLLLSTTTTAGNAVAAQGMRDLDGLFYAPFDWPGPVRRALEAADPALLVLVETELWPNLIHEAYRRGTRVVVVNGRISDRSVGRYRWIRRLLRRVLGEVDLFLMQGEDHAERILALGAPPDRVRVTGNLKFDAADPGRPPEELAHLIEGCPPRPRRLWVAGSTMDGEEELVLQAFRRVRDRVDDAALMIVPRHPERFDAVPPLVEAAGFPCRRRSALEPEGWRNGEVLLLDTLGELAQLYALATVVFVGGSLVPTGGHNILEPAAAGRPVVVGPHMENFREIAARFLSEAAVVQVATAQELGDAVTSLLLEPERARALGERARSVVERNGGAVRRTADALAELVA